MEDIKNLEKQIEEIIKAHEKESRICKLNPDIQTLKRIVNGLVNRKKRFGEFYCPCRVLTKDKQQDEKKICPCVWHEDEVTKDGVCLCGLFVRRAPLSSFAAGP